jgi:hypothetical protein
MNFNLRKKLLKCYIWGIVLYFAGTWTLWKEDQKYLERSEMLCCKMKKYYKRFRVKGVYNTQKEKRRTTECIGRMLCRNSLLSTLLKGKLSDRSEGKTTKKT